MYRPLKFSEVIGQELAVKLITKGFANNKLPNSIIFYGSSGIGKTTLARLIAAWSFCLNKFENDVCGECEMCLGVQNGAIIDVLEFDAASHTSVEDIRAILDLCNYVPQIGDKKIFIIDEAHMLSRNAISALLKTLEESHNTVRFILATTEIDKISNAIKSRCFCIPLQDMKNESIVECLLLTAKKENVEIDNESANLISKVSYGSMREALSIFYRATVLSAKIDLMLLRSILYFVEDYDLELLGDLILNGKYVELYYLVSELLYDKNIVAISLVRQLIGFFQYKFNMKENQEKCVQVMIYLNKLHLEVMKTSMFNEIVLISLCEICYNLHS